MYRRSRFVIAALLVVLTSAVVSYAVSARVPQTLRPSGTTRYAMAQSSTGVNNTSVNNFIPTGLATSVTIPAGKHADVMVVFCSGGDGDDSFLTVRGKIGGSVLLPADGFNLMIGPYITGTHCATFYKTGVGEGTKTVKVEWKALAAGAYLNDRSMIVTLNID